jgi:hypothetical protein
MTARDRFGLFEEGRSYWLLGAALVWLLFAATALMVMSQAIRILTLCMLTGALLIAIAYELTRKGAGERLIPLSALVWAICAATLYAADRFAPPERTPDGALVADNRTAPLTGCDSRAALPKDHLLMIFGGDGVIGRGNGPFTPVRVGTCPALSFTRTASGLTVDGFGFDSDGNVVYRIQKNRFEQILGGFLKGHRPDRSTLRISDDRDIEALRIRYLNKNTVQVWGTFRCGDTRPVRVADGLVSIGSVPTRKKQCATLEPKAPYGIEYSDQAAAP